MPNTLPFDRLINEKNNTGAIAMFEKGKLAHVWNALVLGVAGMGIAEWQAVSAIVCSVAVAAVTIYVQLRGLKLRERELDMKEKNDGDF